MAPIYAPEVRQQFFDTVAEMIFGHLPVKMTMLVKIYENDGTSKLCLESLQTIILAPGMPGLLFKTEGKDWGGMERGTKGGRRRIGIAFPMYISWYSSRPPQPTNRYLSLPPPPPSILHPPPVAPPSRHLSAPSSSSRMPSRLRSWGLGQRGAGEGAGRMFVAKGVLRDRHGCEWRKDGTISADVLRALCLPGLAAIPIGGGPSSLPAAFRVPNLMSGPGPTPSPATMDATTAITVAGGGGGGRGASVGKCSCSVLVLLLLLLLLVLVLVVSGHLLFLPVARATAMPAAELEAFP